MGESTTITETGAQGPKDLGKAMKAALAALEAGGNPVDGKQVSQLVREKLA